MVPTDEAGLVNDGEGPADAVPVQASHLLEYHVEDLPDTLLEEYLGAYANLDQKLVWAPEDYQPPRLLEDKGERTKFLNKAAKRWRKYEKYVSISGLPMATDSQM